MAPKIECSVSDELAKSLREFMSKDFELYKKLKDNNPYRIPPFNSVQI